MCNTRNVFNAYPPHHAWKRQMIITISYTEPLPLWSKNDKEKYIQSNQITLIPLLLHMNIRFIYFLRRKFPHFHSPKNSWNFHSEKNSLCNFFLLLSAISALFSPLETIKYHSRVSTSVFIAVSMRYFGLVWKRNTYLNQ